MTDDSDSDTHSGPYCRHYFDPADCDIQCARCGHCCPRHAFEDGLLAAEGRISELTAGLIRQQITHKARLVALKGQIGTAPHGINCRSMNLDGIIHQSGLPCDCWKSLLSADETS